MVKLWVFAPVFIEDEEELLSSTKGKYGKEDAPAPFNDVLNERCKKHAQMVSSLVGRAQKGKIRTGELRLLL